VDAKKSLFGGAEKMVQAASFIYTRRTSAALNPTQMLMITGA
jgi:hypothetical protein